MYTLPNEIIDQIMLYCDKEDINNWKSSGIVSPYVLKQQYTFLDIMQDIKSEFEDINLDSFFRMGYYVITLGQLGYISLENFGVLMQKTVEKIKIKIESGEMDAVKCKQQAYKFSENFKDTPSIKEFINNFINQIE
jgi:hypothetical protein